MWTISDTKCGIYRGKITCKMFRKRKQSQNKLIQKYWKRRANKLMSAALDCLKQKWKYYESQNDDEKEDEFLASISMIIEKRTKWKSIETEFSLFFRLLLYSIEMLKIFVHEVKDAAQRTKWWNWKSKFCRDFLVRNEMKTAVTTNQEYYYRFNVFDE